MQATSRRARTTFVLGFPIEVHNRGAGSVEVSEDADAAAEADALAYPKLPLATALQMLVHLVYPLI